MIAEQEYYLFETVEWEDPPSQRDRKSSRQMFSIDERKLRPKGECIQLFLQVLCANGTGLFTFLPINLRYNPSFNKEIV